MAMRVPAGKKMACKNTENVHWMNITIPKRKRVLLLHYAAPDVDEIFDITKHRRRQRSWQLHEYFLHKSILPTKCTIFDKQNRKRVNSWTVRLTVITPDFANSRKPASSASDIDKEIKENIILTCTSSSLRRRALGENPTLEALLKLGRALELSAKQAKDEEATGNDSVNKINTKEDDRQSRRCNRTDDSSQSRRNHSPSRNRHYGDKQANLHENVAIVVDMLLKKSMPSARKNLQRLRKK